MKQGFEDSKKNNDKDNNVHTLQEKRMPVNNGDFLWNPEKKLDGLDCSNDICILTVSEDP